jgi:hypothetical protein
MLSGQLPIGRGTFFLHSLGLGVAAAALYLISGKIAITFFGTLGGPTLLIAGLSAIVVAYCFLLNKRSIDIDGTPGHIVCGAFLLYVAIIVLQSFFLKDVGTMGSIVTSDYFRYFETGMEITVIVQYLYSLFVAGKYY